MHAVSAQLAREYPATNEARFGGGRPAGRGAVPGPPPGDASALRRDARRAADRLRQRRLPRPCAQRRTRAGDGRSPRSGLEPSPLVQLMLPESAMLLGASVISGCCCRSGQGCAGDDQSGAAAEFCATGERLAFAAVRRHDRRSDDGDAGLTPASSRRRGTLAQSLRQGDVEGRCGAHRGTLRTILAAQVTVSLVLLVAAALLGRSFVALLKFDPGFEPSGALSFRVQIRQFQCRLA